MRQLRTQAQSDGPRYHLVATCAALLMRRHELLRATGLDGLLSAVNALSVCLHPICASCLLPT